MRLCQLCNQEREEVTQHPVPPATWNAFHNFAAVCAECAVATKNRSRLRIPKKAALTPPAGSDWSTAAPGGTAISHRRTGATLQVVDGPLARAELGGALLSSALLAGAALTGANLRKADLRLADLGGASLRGADLRGADLRGADLRSADLREARLDHANLHSSRCDKGTVWPAGFNSAGAGALFE
jgi:hypothetical protein